MSASQTYENRNFIDHKLMVFLSAISYCLICCFMFFYYCHHVGLLLKRYVLSSFQYTSYVSTYVCTPRFTTAEYVMRKVHHIITWCLQYWTSTHAIGWPRPGMHCGRADRTRYYSVQSWVLCEADEIMNLCEASGRGMNSGDNLCHGAIKAASCV